MQKKMPARPINKKMRTQTSGLKGFQNFDIDTTTGFPICPRTRKIIDGTDSYCKTCFSFGHSRISSNECIKHGEWLAENENKKKRKREAEALKETDKNQDKNIE